MDSYSKMGKWKKQQTYQHIADQCVKYVQNNYGKKSIVVFDGYPLHPTTKDPTHTKRTKPISTRPDVTRTSKLGVEKNVFFSNVKNKQNMINLTGERSSECGIEASNGR